MNGNLFNYIEEANSVEPVKNLFVSTALNTYLLVHIKQTN